MDSPVIPPPAVTTSLPTRPRRAAPVPEPAPTGPSVTTSLPTRPVGGRTAAPGADVRDPLQPYIPPAAEQIRPASRRRAVGFGLAGLLLLGAALLAAGLFTTLPAGAVPMGQVLAFVDQGHTHIARAQPHPTYNSDPPTSGWHREEFPTDPGKFVYDQTMDDEVTVHLMEHGNLIAWYSCAAGSDCTTLRDGLARETQKVPPDASYRLYVMPRESLPGGARIALGAWQHLEYLRDFDQQKVDEFLKRFGGSVQEVMPGVTPTP